MGRKEQVIQLNITRSQLDDIHFAILSRAAELVQIGKDAYDHDKWRTQQDRLDVMNSYFEHANRYHDLARLCERIKQGIYEEDVK